MELVFFVFEYVGTLKLRTEKVGFAAFLHACRVSDVISPACRCGWRKEDPKAYHYILPGSSAPPSQTLRSSGDQSVRTDDVNGERATGSGHMRHE